MSSLPLALVTNDDGVDSPLLHHLIDALRPHFRVLVAAPAREQSWVGRAMSRRRAVAVDAIVLRGVSGWSIDGTPSDCVNLALGHLLPERPAIVVAGLNVGYNTAVPLLLSSGTVAGAIEGAHWGLPAVACSQALQRPDFLSLSGPERILPPALEPVVAASAARTAAFAAEQVQRAPQDLIVHNLNFPVTMTAATPLRETIPARLSLGGLFQPNAEGAYEFAFSAGRETPSASLTDRAALARGEASWSRLNFSTLSGSIGVSGRLDEPASNHVS